MEGMGLKKGLLKRGATNKRGATKREVTKREVTKRGATKREVPKRGDTKKGPLERQATKRGATKIGAGHFICTCDCQNTFPWVLFTFHSASTIPAGSVYRLTTASVATTFWDLTSLRRKLSSSNRDLWQGLGKNTKRELNTNHTIMM